MKNYEDGNCLIAEYMDGKLNSFFYQFPIEFGYQESWDEGGFVGSGPSTSWNIDELAYHESWDWLIPVYKKINGLISELSRTDFAFGHGSDKLHLKMWNILEGECEIEDLWEAITEFLKWYNGYEIIKNEDNI